MLCRVIYAVPAKISEETFHQYCTKEELEKIEKYEYDKSEAFWDVVSYRKPLKIFVSDSNDCFIGVGLGYFDCHMKLADMQNLLTEEKKEEYRKVVEELDAVRDLTPEIYLVMEYC